MALQRNKIPPRYLCNIIFNMTDTNLRVYMWKDTCHTHSHTEIGAESQKNTTCTKTIFLKK